MTIKLAKKIMLSIRLEHKLSRNKDNKASYSSIALHNYSSLSNITFQPQEYTSHSCTFDWTINKDNQRLLLHHTISQQYGTDKVAHRSAIWQTILYSFSWEMVHGQLVICTIQTTYNSILIWLYQGTLARPNIHRVPLTLIIIPCILVCGIHCMSKS